jgi:hypothetical protein
MLDHYTRRKDLLPPPGFLFPGYIKNLPTHLINLTPNQHPPPMRPGKKKINDVQAKENIRSVNRGIYEREKD